MQAARLHSDVQASPPAPRTKQPMNPRIHAFLAALAILLASGVMYHLLAGDSAELDVAVARVPLVPQIVGAWHGHDEAADERSFEQAGAKGYWMRTYVN